MNKHFKITGKYIKTQSIFSQIFIKLATYRFRLLGLIILILILYPHSHSVLAQCPMCRMSAESNMANGGEAGKGLNTGILYLLALPYIIAATMIYLFRKNRKKLEQG